MKVIYGANTDITSLTGLDWDSDGIALPEPDPFVSFEPVIEADTRRTLGGKVFSRVRTTLYRALLSWSVLPAADRLILHTWWLNTNGWRRSFALLDEDAGIAYLGAMPSAEFPLRYVGGVTAHYSMGGPVQFDGYAMAAVE